MEIVGRGSAGILVASFCDRIVQVLIFGENEKSAEDQLQERSRKQSEGTCLETISY